MPQLFISYSRKDKEFVQKLHEALTREKRDVWVDWEDIPPTAKWLNEIYKGIESADNFIFVIGPDSLASQTCGMEIAHGEKHNKRVIPLLYRDPGQEKIRDVISSHNWISFNEEAKFEESLKDLLKAIDTDLEYVNLHTSLLLKAQEWMKSERSEAYVLEGEQLRESEKWLAGAEGKKPAPTALHKKFIAESLKSEKEDAEQKKRRKLYVALRDETLRVYIRPFLNERRLELEKRRNELIRDPATKISLEVAEIEEELNGLLNFLNTGGKWHLNEPISIKKLGASKDYLDVFEFPCCGANVVADKPPSRFRRDGCQDSPLPEDVDDEPAPLRTLLGFRVKPKEKKAEKDSKEEKKG